MMRELFLLAAAFCTVGVAVTVWTVISFRVVVGHGRDLARADKQFYMEHLHYTNARNANADSGNGATAGILPDEGGVGCKPCA